MKITDIRFGMLRVPLKTPFKTALRTVDTVEDIVVAIHTDTGHVGYGEAPATAPITGDTHGSIVHAASRSPFWKSASWSGFTVGTTSTSPPVWVISKPCAVSHARQATSCVLPSCGVATRRPRRSTGPVMPAAVRTMPIPRDLLARARRV